MADADECHDLTEYSAVFLAELRKGQGLRDGQPVPRRTAYGAMPFLHQYLGGGVPTGDRQAVFQVEVRGLSLRVQRFPAGEYRRMDMRSTGMEFASEMVVKALRYK